MCENVLGYRPLPSDIKHGWLKVSSLLNQLSETFNVDSHNECIKRARIIIMCLFAGSIFPTTTTGLVPLIYLSHLENLSVGFSWGSACLACLYRNLNKAALSNAIEISGPVYVLQLWAWERIVVLSPRRVGPQHASEFAYGAR